ncbi:MAG: PAS domain-containing protein [Proteobacteria bacterium]|nr:PAS domain-containing protein [Pseudomonadota bacterium]MBU1234614.1 PAS domain-containing protein [Pseudomonadota bacterium]MBU1416987.1 PAS domain-containing protein [Pseudomonadota bacterium]MBU1453683.1 PAS domain-containing protein [Pseudomonadota bacterium]
MSDTKEDIGKHLIHAEYPDSQYFYLDRRKGGGPTRGGNELFQAIQDPVFVVTPSGIIVGANHAALKAAQKSRSEIIGKGICKIIHGGSSPHLKCPLEACLLTCSPRVEETILPGLSGEYLLTISPVKNHDGTVRKILIVARELTSDEMRKEDSLRTAQLAAIGELAAGVAHEVNNPITGIINFAQLLLDDSEKNSLQEELLERIVTEGERIASIIKKLLSFARESDNDNEPIDLVQVIQDSISLVEHQFKNDGIKIITDYSTEPCSILGNFRQLQQVVLNLLSNAHFALKERYPTSSTDKEIRISCHLIIKEEGQSIVQVSIRDSGTGIPQGILNRLFDPFFTTKPSGKGTGLGLSISYGIIRDHGGIIKVDSIINQYTDMIIIIPALGA